MAGLLEWFLGKPPSTKYDIGFYQKQGLADMLQPWDFRGMAEQRMAYGHKPIDWPKILVDMFEAESRLRPLTDCEVLLYQGALQAFNEARAG